jgi:hypothetical protein
MSMSLDDIITTAIRKLELTQQVSRLKRRRRQQEKQKQYQQYMVPFLFQQSINKKYTGLDLYYYDKVWFPVVQNRLQRGRSFQEQYKDLYKFQKSSASQSVVYRGTYKGRSVFVKSFESGTTPEAFRQLSDDIQTLSYEKEVYRKIRYVAETNSEVRRHFINMLFCVKDATNGIAYIFSQDSGGRSLTDYITKERLTYPFIVGVMTQYLYILHLLHNVLHITHNDLHTGNLIVVRDNQPNKTYTIGGKTFRLRNHPYTLMVYDFDQSSMFDPPEWQNPFTEYMCDKYGRCKNFPATDLYIYLQILIGYSSPEHYASDRDDMFYTLLLANYKTLMPRNLLNHVENTTLHYAPCQAKTWDNKCVLPNEPITLSELVDLWHKSIYTPTETLNPLYMLKILANDDFKKYFGTYIFLLKKEGGYYITTEPNTAEIRESIIETNKIIANGKIGSLLTDAPNKQDANYLTELFWIQYRKLGAMKQKQQLRQHLNKL